MRELLADGEWHERDEVLEAMAAVVPPGRAFRHRQRTLISQRQRDRSRGVPEGPSRPLTEEQAITVGARGVARESLEMQFRMGHVERDGDRYRLAGGR